MVKLSLFCAKMKLFWKNNKWEFFGAYGDGQSFEFPVYKIEHEGKEVTFATGEFSNCM